MERLYRQIRQAVEDGRIVYSIHASNQLAARGIERWQVVGTIDSATLLGTYPAAKPNPKILLQQCLADGTEVIAVWAYVRSMRSAKLVTVYSED